MRSAAPSPNERSQLLDVLLDVARDEPLGQLRRRHPAEPRGESRPAGLPPPQFVEPLLPAPPVGVDPGEELAQRQRAVAPDDADAKGIVGRPADRDIATAGNDPLELAEPERKHLG